MALACAFCAAARCPSFPILWTRGLWLVLLEFTLVRLGFFFSLTTGPLFLIVFWALGVSMIVLALLIRLPFRVLLGVSVAMIALHNLTDPVPAAAFGSFAWLWQILHQQSLINAGIVLVVVAYPLVPWIGVMGVGFCLARVYGWPDDERRRFLVGFGLALTAAFVVVRGLNIYGDPQPWAVQPRAGLTISLLNCTSTRRRLFLLMTLGPAITTSVCSIARHRATATCSCSAACRCCISSYILLIHAAEIGLAWLRMGRRRSSRCPAVARHAPRTAFRTRLAPLGRLRRHRRAVRRCIRCLCPASQGPSPAGLGISRP